MTIPAFAEGLGGRLPSDSEKAAANQLRKILAAQVAGTSTLRVLNEEPDGTAEIILTPALSALLMELLRHVGRGDAVTLVPVGKLLTTQQAADILNVSRPFLVSLLDRGDIPHTLVGRHRRIRAEDVFAYKNARAVRRNDALSRLAEMDADLI